MHVLNGVITFFPRPRNIMGGGALGPGPPPRHQSGAKKKGKGKRENEREKEKRRKRREKRKKKERGDKKERKVNQHDERVAMQFQAQAGAPGKKTFGAPN